MDGRAMRSIFIVHGKWLRPWPRGYVLAVGVSVVDGELVAKGPSSLLQPVPGEAMARTVESGLYSLCEQRPSGRRLYRVGTREEVLAWRPDLAPKAEQGVLL